jgi:hypothetical protein
MASSAIDTVHFCRGCYRHYREHLDSEGLKTDYLHRSESVAAVLSGASTKKEKCLPCVIGFGAEVYRNMDFSRSVVKR